MTLNESRTILNLGIRSKTTLGSMNKIIREADDSKKDVNICETFEQEYDKTNVIHEELAR